MSISPPLLLTRASCVVGVDGGPLWLRDRLCELIVLAHDILVGRVTLPYVRLGHGWSKLQTRNTVEPQEVVDELRPPMDLRHIPRPIGSVGPLQYVGTVIIGLVGVPVTPPSVKPVKVQIRRELHRWTVLKLANCLITQWGTWYSTAWK